MERLVLPLKEYDVRAQTKDYTLVKNYGSLITAQVLWEQILCSGCQGNKSGYL
jgi:hypothetical protein